MKSSGVDMEYLRFLYNIKSKRFQSLLRTEDQKINKYPTASLKMNKDKIFEYNRMGNENGFIRNTKFNHSPSFDHDYMNNYAYDRQQPR